MPFQCNCKQLEANIYHQLWSLPIHSPEKRLLVCLGFFKSKKPNHICSYGLTGSPVSVSYCWPASICFCSFPTAAAELFTWKTPWAPELCFPGTCGAAEPRAKPGLAISAQRRRLLWKALRAGPEAKPGLVISEQWQRSSPEFKSSSPVNSAGATKVISIWSNTVSLGHPESQCSQTVLPKLFLPI